MIALISAPFYAACVTEDEEGHDSIVDVTGPGSPIPGQDKGHNNTPPLVNPDAGQITLPPGPGTWDGGMYILADSGEPESLLDRSVPMPNFSLVDKNPNSPDIGEYFAPRQFIGRVSGWYFSHST
jgi:hypothetical protein